ncbi:MAG: hypothetical protein EP330_24225 [Deltaproteobacteria bacterium]|nr:MAG: hypothetical protein EP330_24225 [Deltaproteobacteria bacterium]
MVKLQAAAALLFFLLGCVVQVLGVLWFEQVDAWYADWAVGAVISITGLVMGMNAFPQLMAKNYALDAPPPLSLAAYREALEKAELPVWTCNRCKLVEPGDGLGSCVYCDSSMEFLQVDDEAVRQTALTAAH